jgi:fatty acyl-CoA reductase
VKVVEGDVTLPQLGMDEATASHLIHQLDLVINVAGLVDFSPDVRRALSCNVDGALYAAEFVSQCKKASLMHVSTCYGAGNATGMHAEKIITDKNPKGNSFNAEAELQLVNQAIEELTRQKEKSLTRRLIELGDERAKINGWCNTYVYSKSLAESLLVSRYPNLRLAIVRPSIIESAQHFPFAGWNEGYNTTAPLCYVVGRWLPFFVGNKNNYLDMIPVDMVCKGMLVIGAAQIENKAEFVYQLATSELNPCTIKVAVKSARAWHQKMNQWSRSASLKTWFTMRYVAPDAWLAPKFLADKLNKLANLLPGSYTFMQSMKKTIQNMAKDLERIDKVYLNYLPFTYDHQYVFQSRAITRLEAIESHFVYDAKQLPWDEYIFNTHCPGVNKWVFSLLDGKPPEKKSFEIFTSEEQSELLSMINVSYVS